MAESSPGGSPPSGDPTLKAESSIRVFLVDDHPVVRMGLRHLFEQMDRASVAGEADSGGEALSQISELAPDLALVDISLGGIEEMGGIELTRRLQDRCPNVSVLIISIHDETYYVKQALEAGAQGYIRKDEVGNVLSEAITSVVRGEYYLSEASREALQGMDSPGKGSVPAAVSLSEEGALVGKSPGNH